MENTNILGKNINTNVLNISDKDQEFDQEQIIKIQNELDKQIEVIFTFRHGARLDHGTSGEDPNEYQECGGIDYEFDTPLQYAGHQQAKITGLYIKQVLEKQIQSKRKIVINLWSSPYLRCIQTIAGAANQLSDHQQTYQLNISEYLSELQLSGYCNDTCKISNLLINQNQQLDRYQELFFQEKIYKFLDNKKIDLDLFYPSRSNQDYKYKDSLTQNLCQFQLEYPEGGEGAKFPKNANSANKRFQTFYREMIKNCKDKKVSKNIVDQPLIVHLVCSHGNCVEQLAYAFYKKKYDQNLEEEVKWNDINIIPNPFKVDVYGIDFCSLSIHGYGKAEKKIDNFFQNEELVKGWTEILYANASHVGLCSASWIKQEE